MAEKKFVCRNLMHQVDIVPCMVNIGLETKLLKLIHLAKNCCNIKGIKNKLPNFCQKN